MDTILEDIEKAMAAGCYYVAVHMALALPDICAALEVPNGQTSGKQYQVWYNSHLTAISSNLTAADCWNLRCGVLHQGRFGHPNMQYARIVFTLPNVQKIVFHDNVVNDALNLDAVKFCCDVIAAVRTWFGSKQNDINVQQNLEKLVQFRPQGMSPYIVGVPVIC